MKLNFLGGFYQTRSKVLAAQSCINLYLEMNEMNGTDGALLGTPGLLTQTQLPDQAEVRALREVLGSLYAVCGPTVYRLDANFNYTKLGTLPNSTGIVSVTDNGTQVLFSHQDGWHYCLLTGPLAPVADPDQPKGAIVTGQDNYVLFTTTNAPENAEFGITQLNDVTSIDPLDVATAEGAPDGLIAIICDHREVWLLGQKTFEVWSDTGNALFPFERIPGGMGQTGCAAARCVVQADDSVFWLTNDLAGNATMIRTNAYRPARISTYAVEHAWEQYERLDDAIGFAYQQEGHEFVMVIFPSADRSWSYDISASAITGTPIWQERMWQDEGGILHRHRANCYAFFNGQHVVGDFENGKLYVLDLDTGTDDGGSIYRERACMLPDAEHKRIRTDSVELIAEMGKGNLMGADTVPQVWLEVSHDGGESFGYQRFQNLGRMGKRLVRALWRRLGIGRQTVLKFCTTTTTKVAWLGANAEGEALS